MKKDVSYIARNERKYVDRRIKALQLDMKTLSAKEKTATKNYIKQLKSLQKQTYIKSRNPESRAKALEATLKLRSLARIGTNTKIARQNKIFEREINIASTGKKKTFFGSARRSRAYTAIFYQATRNIWQGHPAHMRNALILRGLKEVSLKRAFAKVLAANRKTLQFIEQSINTGAYTNQRIQNKVGSPDELSTVNTIDDESDLSHTISDTFNDTFSNISQNYLWKKLQDIYKNSSSYEDFRNQVENELQDYFDENPEALEGLKNISEEAKNIGEAIRDFGEDVVNVVKDNVKEFVKGMAEDGTAEGNAEIEEEFAEEGFFKTLSENLPEIIENIASML